MTKLNIILCIIIFFILIVFNLNNEYFSIFNKNTLELNNIINKMVQSSKSIYLIDNIDYSDSSRIINKIKIGSDGDLENIIESTHTFNQSNYNYNITPIVYNNKIYVIGNSDTVYSIEVINIDSNGSITDIESTHTLNQSNYNITPIVYNNKIYVIGYGNTYNSKENKYMYSIEVITIDSSGSITDITQSEKTLNQSNYTVPIVYNNKIYVIGNSDDSDSDSNYIYNIEVITIDSSGYITDIRESPYPLKKKTYQTYYPLLL